jgi:hypothetical protein
VRTGLLPSRNGFLLGETDSPDGGIGLRAREIAYLLPESALLLRETGLPPSRIGSLLGETDFPMREVGSSERETANRVCAIGHLPHETSRSVHEIGG